MASLYKRGKVWWVKYSMYGKIYRDTLKTRNKKYAKRMLVDIEYNILQGNLPFPLANKTKMSDLGKLIIKNYKKKIRSKRSIKEVTHKVEVLLSFFNPNAPPNSVTSDRIDEFVDEMALDERQNATINRYLAVLRRMFNLGRRRDPPLVYKKLYIEMLPENEAKTSFFELEQYLKLRDAIAPYLKLFITFAYYYGFRSGELRKIKWDYIDRSMPIWYLRLPGIITKNKKPRVLPLNKEAIEGLEKEWQYKKENNIEIPYVFLNKNKTGPIKDFRSEWNQACREKKLGSGYKMGEDDTIEKDSKLKSGPTLHDLRRSAARNTRRSGVNKEQAMKVTGHRTSAVFDDYNIIIDRDLEKAVQQRYEFEREEMKKLERYNAQKNDKK